MMNALMFCKGLLLASTRRATLLLFLFWSLNLPYKVSGKNGLFYGCFTQNHNECGQILLSPKTMQYTYFYSYEHVFQSVKFKRFNSTNADEDHIRLYKVPPEDYYELSVLIGNWNEGLLQINVAGTEPDGYRELLLDSTSTCSNANAYATVKFNNTLQYSYWCSLTGHNLH